MGGQIQEYIGYPGSQTNRMGSQSMKFREHMEEKFVIAEIKPLKSKAEGTDGNLYRGENAIGDFKTDLGKAGGHSMKGDVLKIVISNPQSVTETYSNQFGDSELFGGSGRSLVGGAAQDLAFLGGVKNTAELDQLAQEFKKDNPIIGGALAGITGTYQSAMQWAKTKGAQMTSEGKGALGGALDMMSEIGQHPWSKVNWPQMWKNCSYQQSYELTTRLYCYYNDNPQDYSNNILAPLAALQLLVTPKSDDGVLYQWPYIFDFKIDGVLHMSLAYCSNLTVVKGGDEGDFAADGRPNIIDVRMSIQNCYSVMVNCASPKSKDTPTVGRDNEGLSKGKANSSGSPEVIGNSTGGGPKSNKGQSPQAQASSSSPSAAATSSNNPSSRGANATEANAAKKLGERK